jgi:hypothetical protein
VIQDSFEQRYLINNLTNKLEVLHKEKIFFDWQSDYKFFEQISSVRRSVISASYEAEAKVKQYRDLTVTFKLSTLHTWLNPKHASSFVKKTFEQMDKLHRLQNVHETRSQATRTRKLRS